LAQAADPIEIGFSASLMGACACSGQTNLFAQDIWVEEITATEVSFHIRYF
jgi:hypothetical protein